MEPSAVDLAVRSLARRERSEADVRRILARKGVDEGEADEALETLRRVGAVDDERFAAGAADSLARRGYGDAGIIRRLAREGIGRELALDSLAAVTPEAERAAVLVERRGATARTARWLMSRGFSRDSIEHALAAIAESGTAELG